MENKNTTPTNIDISNNNYDQEEKSFLRWYQDYDGNTSDKHFTYTRPRPSIFQPQQKRIFSLSGGGGSGGDMSQFLTTCTCGNKKFSHCKSCGKNILFH